MQNLPIEENNDVYFELLDWQARLHQVQAHESYVLAARGTGKTTFGLAPWMIRVAESMPGHLCGVFGLTFEHLNKNIMPKILLGFNELGYHHGVDYVIGKPPKGWPACVYPIKQYDRTFTWRNGSTFHQVSLHERGSANAFDFQAGVFDETKFMDISQLEDEVFPTFRGFESRFGHKAEYLSKIFATDKMIEYPRIKWLLDKRDKVDPEKVDRILKLQDSLDKIMMVIDDQPASVQNKLNILARKLQVQLTRLRKTTVYVAEAAATSNIKNLGQQWLDDKKKSMTPYVYSVAIENNDPIDAMETFYSKLTPEHSYEEDYPGSDYNPLSPLIIASDYQHSVAPICVAQLTNQPHRELRFINEFSTLYPEGLEEAIDLFCNYYALSPCKIVYYVFDQTAIGRRPSAKPMNQIIVSRLVKNGWSVREIYTGDPPDGVDKYMKINSRLANPGNTAIMRFNKSKCYYTLISMRGSNTITENGKTKKDKRFENTKQYPSLDQRTTTHFSDTVDQIEWAVNELQLIHYGIGAQGAPISIR